MLLFDVLWDLRSGWSNRTSDNKHHGSLHVVLGYWYKNRDNYIIKD